MNLPFFLAGKTALITGGATGLGLAMTACMIEAGARVVVGGRDKTHFDENCAQFGDKAVFFAGDVAQTDTIPALVDDILAVRKTQRTYQSREAYQGY